MSEQNYIFNQFISHDTYETLNVYTLILTG